MEIVGGAVVKAGVGAGIVQGVIDRVRKRDVREAWKEIVEFALV